jgi:hypothetical protein
MRICAPDPNGYSLPGSSGMPSSSTGTLVLMRRMQCRPRRCATCTCLREIRRSGSGSASVQSLPRPMSPPSSPKLACIGEAGGSPPRDTTRIEIMGL